MKKYKIILSVLISSFILFVVSCANASTLFSKADHAKKRANNIVCVTYDVDGGAQLEKTVYDFSLGTNPQNIPTPQRDGYYFRGWYTKKNGAGERFTENFILVDSITVYAKWEVNQNAVTITLDSTQYYIGVNETFIISGSYTPINATEPLCFVNSSLEPITQFGNIAIIEDSIECNNGRFSVQVQTIARGTYSGYVQSTQKSNVRRAFTIYSGIIRQIDPEGTITTIDVPLFTTSTVTIPFDPPTADYDFSVAFTYTDSTYQRMLGYSIQNDKLTLTSLGETEYTGLKQVLGSIGLRITDSISGKTKNITVRIVPVESTVIPITPIPTVTSTNYDYETTISSEKPFQIYSLNLKQGKGYQFFYIASQHSYFRFFYPSFSSITNSYSDNSRQQYVYLPTSTGTYYLSVATYEPTQTDTTARLYVWEFDPITELNLSESSINIQSGQSTTLQLTYSPEDSPVSFYLDQSYYRVTQTNLSSNSVTIDTLVPGVSTIYVTDSYSGKSTTCVVNVTWDNSKNIVLPPITNAAGSSDINDYTEFTLISTQRVFVYEIQLESGKTYHFLNVDSLHAGTGNDVDRQNRIDCYFYLKNTNFDYLSSADDRDLTYTCRESGTYYYIVTGYSFGNTGRGAFYIWAEDTP